MRVGVTEIIDPNGEGTSEIVTVSMGSHEMLNVSVSVEERGVVFSFDMPAGYAGQLGGKLLETMQEIEAG